MCFARGAEDGFGAALSDEDGPFENTVAGELAVFGGAGCLEGLSDGEQERPE